MGKRKSYSILLAYLLLNLLVLSVRGVVAQVTIPPPDQTPDTPLNNPTPNAVNPRYLSGFGIDDRYSIFYEERSDTDGCIASFRIYYNQTTSGAFGFSPSSIKTNICDTHLVVKDWPITIGGITYAYRAWGARSYNFNGTHTFYVTNDLTNWTLIKTFVFNNPYGISGTVHYGFHDIIRLNGEYYGFAETTIGRTVIVHSVNGDHVWEVVASVGGSNVSFGPLYLPASGGVGPTPTGNFLLMNVDEKLVYGKVSVVGDDSAMYLAINAAAAQANTPSQAAAAFIDPANWTWRDGSTGQPDIDSMLMADTSTSGGHDIREVWTTPMSNPDSDWVILYSAEYISGSDPDGRAFGCASVTKDCTINPPSDDSTDTDKSRVGDEIKNEDPLILPETGFRPNMITDLQAQPSWKAYAQHNSLMLEIESLGIQVQIVGVPYIGRTWDVTWLGSRAGYLHGTAFPTWPGNTVITAHVYGADGLPGPFVELHSLSYDDEIFITAWGQKYLYQVRENFLAYPDDKMIFNHNTYDWLTLLTCEGYDERNNFYNYRRIIQAVLTQIIS